MTAKKKSTARLAYVIQKHAASHLHFDLRLELDGVMKSWAVPKGPSLDPAVKRLAMQVEDHPIEYNGFEGTIPRGQYGGGTVMLWDRGTYTYGGELGDEDPEEALRRGYERGDMKILLQGERLGGSWALVRMRREAEGRPQWLLIKHRNAFADATGDVVAEHPTSVATGRTMEAIAGGARRSGAPRPPKTATKAKTAKTAKKSTVKKRTRGRTVGATRAASSRSEG